MQSSHGVLSPPLLVPDTVNRGDVGVTGMPNELLLGLERHIADYVALLIYR